MGSIPEAKAEGAILNEEENTCTNTCEDCPLEHFFFENVQISRISVELELLSIHRFHSLDGVEGLMST